MKECSLSPSSYYDGYGWWRIESKCCWLYNILCKQPNRPKIFLIIFFLLLLSAVFNVFSDIGHHKHKQQQPIQYKQQIFNVYQNCLIFQIFFPCCKYGWLNEWLVCFSLCVCMFWLQRAHDSLSLYFWCFCDVKMMIKDSKIWSNNILSFFSKFIIIDNHNNSVQFNRWFFLTGLIKRLTFVKFFWIKFS